MPSNKSLNEQLILPIALEDKASFANFYVGDNDELVEALLAAIDSKKNRFIYIYGGTGTGKSHLLFAAIKLAADTGLKTQYLSLKNAQATPELLEVIDVNSFVCVDDIMSWAGDNAKERALFTVFERIKQAKGSLLVSAEQPAEQSEFVLRDLVSRLGSGLIYALHDLNDEQRFEAIKLRAEQRAMSISDETVQYLLSRSARDTKLVFNLLDKIDRASLMEKRRITIPFLKSIMV